MKEEEIQSLGFVNDVVYSNNEIKIIIELPSSKKHIILVILKNSNLYNIYKNKIKRDNIIGFKAKLNDIKQYSPSNLFVLDEKIEWSNTKYNEENSNKKVKSLIHHTEKHPIKERRLYPWEGKTLNILYNDFDATKKSYEKISKSIVINNMDKRNKWLYNDDHSSLDFDTIIDKDYTLRVSIKHSEASKPVISTCHFRDENYNENRKNINEDEKVLYCVYIHEEDKYADLYELYNSAYYHLRKLKWRKTRYFRDVPSAFYTSDQYDFYETIDNIEKLVLFRSLLNSNDYFKKDIQQYNKLKKRYNKLKKRYIEFIENKNIEYIFYDLERIRGIETN